MTGPVLQVARPGPFEPPAGGVDGGGQHGARVGSGQVGGGGQDGVVDEHGSTVAVADGTR